MKNKRIDLPKECIVIYKPTGQYMGYNKEGNYVYPVNYDYHIFPAKHRARSAVNTAIEMRKAEGVERPQDDYEIIEV